MRRTEDADPEAESLTWIEREKKAALAGFDRRRFETRLKARIGEKAGAPRRVRPDLAWTTAIALTVPLLVLGLLGLLWLQRPGRPVEAATVEAALRQVAGGWAGKPRTTPPSILATRELQTQSWQIQRLIYHSQRRRDDDDVGPLVMATLAAAQSAPNPAAGREIFPDIDHDALGRRIDALRRGNGMRRLFDRAKPSTTDRRRT